MKQANEKMKELRDKVGINQTDLAAKVGITQAAISAIEIGLTESPSVDVAQKIAMALGTTVEELFPVNTDNAA